MTNGGINQGTFYSDCLQVLKEVGVHYYKELVSLIMVLKIMETKNI